MSHCRGECSSAKAETTDKSQSLAATAMVSLKHSHLEQVSIRLTDGLTLPFHDRENLLFGYQAIGCSPDSPYPRAFNFNAQVFCFQFLQFHRNKFTLPC